MKHELNWSSDVTVPVGQISTISTPGYRLKLQSSLMKQRDEANWNNVKLALNKLKETERKRETHSQRIRKRKRGRWRERERVERERQRERE